MDHQAILTQEEVSRAVADLVISKLPPELSLEVEVHFFGRHPEKKEEDTPTARHIRSVWDRGKQQQKEPSPEDLLLKEWGAIVSFREKKP